MNEIKRQVVVTGGAGFIGSHLTDKLLADGHTVVVIDDLRSGSKGNLVQHEGNPHLTLREVDISSDHDLSSYFDDADWVFHLAGMADIVPSIEKPELYFKSNVEGTLNVLQAAKSASVKSFVYSASSSCYGLPDLFPTPEGCEIKPMYPYALTKYLGEQLVTHWHQLYALPVTSLRLFNVFGPRSRAAGAYGAVFGVFLAQKLANKPFTVVGDGTQSRDFTFVSDVVEAMIVAAKSDVKGEVFNVGSGGTYSINRIVDLLEGDTVHIPKRPGEPDCTYADITKIRDLLDWQPRMKFEDGVRIIRANIEEWKEAPVWDEDSIASATQSWFKYLSD